MTATPTSPRRDSGLSLAEMLVTIVIFGIVTAAITTVIITGLGHQNQVADRSDTLAQMRTAIERVDRDIRSANPLCAATYTDVQVQEDDPTPRIVDYSIMGTSLVVTQYSVSAAGDCQESAGAISGPTVLLTNLVSPTKVFSVPTANYYECSSNPNPANPALVDGGVAKITALAINLSDKPKSLNQPVSLSDCGTDLRNST